MNILLPTDFSENARNAAAYALRLFEEVPAHFYLLHVITIPADQWGKGHLVMSKETREKFEDLLTRLNKIKKNQEHSFHINFKVSYFIEAIREEVAEKNINLILMGTKGANNKNGTVIGKHTTDVMMKVKCPALAISEKAVFKSHKKVLFPTDYKIDYNAKMLETLLKFTNLSKASVKILELFNSDTEPSEEQKANKILLQNSFSPGVPAVQTYYSVKKTDHKVLFHTNDDVDMIVMAAKNLNLCQKLLKNQTLGQIPFINQLPLLVLHG